MLPKWKEEVKISLCFYIEKGIFATGVVIVEIEREQFRYGVVIVSIWVVVVVKNGIFRLLKMGCCWCGCFLAENSDFEFLGLEYVDGAIVTEKLMKKMRMKWKKIMSFIWWKSMKIMMNMMNKGG